MVRRAGAVLLSLASGLALGCDGAARPPDATAEATADATVDAAVDPADGHALADAGDGATGACATHHDCAQGAYCHRGACRTDTIATYHCGKPGCPPGHWCVHADGARDVCDEDPGYPCASACDCGPAHCCLDGRCVRDGGDPFSGAPGVASACPVGPRVAADARLPTYCATDPTCLVAASAWSASGRAGTFLAHDPATGEAIDGCGGEGCFGTACDCADGQSCVDVVSPRDTGAVCGLFTGGTCVSDAIAESVFGFAAADLLECCDSCSPGRRCDAGWMRTGNRDAYRRVVAVCAGPAGCSCGDGECCPEELADCPADCLPPYCTAAGACTPVRCGDGRCDPFEDERACAADCPRGCGDGLCDPSESASTCVTDCRDECGDGWCSASEITARGSCPEDCDGRCFDAGGYSRRYRVCGDGRCEQASSCDYLEPETCASCPRDCGACEWTVTELHREGQILGFPDGVRVYSESDVWVSTQATNGRLLFHYDGAGWRRSREVSGMGIWGARSGHLVAGADPPQVLEAGAWSEMVAPRVGESLGVFGRAEDEVYQASEYGVLYYDGSVWTELGSGAPRGADVWASGPDDVYVATEGGQLHHFDGTGWTELHPPSGGRLTAVWGRSADDVLAAGSDADSARVVRFDGSAWTDVSPAGAGAVVDLWSTPTSDLFALDVEGTLLRYDGAAWSSFPAAAPFEARALSGSADDVIFGVGFQGERGVIQRFDGARWYELTGVTAPELYLGDVWGTGADDVRMVVGGRLYHFDGTELSYTTLSTPPPTRPDFAAVFGFATGELFVGGVYLSPGATRPDARTSLRRQVGGSWTEWTFSGKSPIYELWGLAPDHLFAFGQTYYVLHFDGSRFTRYDFPFDRFADAWGSSDADVFIVGADAILRCDTSPCRDPTTFARTTVEADLRAVWGTGPTNVLAAGDGVILRWDGASWSEMWRGPESLRDLSGRSASDVVAVGDAGRMLRYDGASWRFARTDLRRFGSSRCPQLSAIVNAGGALVVATSDDRVVIDRPPAP